MGPCQLSFWARRFAHFRKWHLPKQHGNSICQPFIFQSKALILPPLIRRFQLRKLLVSKQKPAKRKRRLYLLRDSQNSALSTPTKTQSVERRKGNSLKTNTDLVILPVEKGNATVFLDKTQYVDKIHSSLQDGSYSILPRDPTSSVEHKITTLLRSGDFPTDVLTRLRPRNCQPSRIYGLPKIHKSN